MENNKKIFDAQGNEVNLTQSDFEFCQVDKKIHDAKFETKATTFAKDAFKRFCKNKSSVVGAFIIGILVVLSIFVPIVNKHDIDNPNLSQTFLEPKLFEAGTGFWDGTKVVKNIPYDPKTDAPAGYKKHAVVEVLDTREVIADNYSEFAHGGTYVYELDEINERGYEFLQHVTYINYKKDNGITLDIKFSDKLPNEEYELAAEYQIELLDDLKQRVMILKDWSSDYSDVSINISEAITKNVKGFIRVNAKPHAGSSKRNVILIESLEYKTTSDDEKLVTLLETISITDANATKQLGTKDTGYWNSTGVTSVLGVVLTYMDFVYDPYEAQLGLREDFVVGKSTIEQYIAKGWMEYNFDEGIESFKVLDEEKCPVLAVYEQIYNKDVGTTNLVCDITYYKYAGHDKMPKFLMGTNGSGYDLLKQCFYGLRTSLILSIITFAVCFTFGLCWGSISGYFGGNVDLAMERFCDILGGVPWIVVMTLAIVLMGNNLVTFAMALCLTGWMGTAARTRTQFYRFKGREYVLSSRTLGASDGRLIFKHILPNSLGTLVTSAVLMIPSTIFSEASLSYLNLGLQGVQSFGTILSEHQQYLGSYPFLILFPAVIISLIMISFNLFGNGLRDALNPSLKGSD